MRNYIAGAALGALVLGCSSKSTASGPTCDVAGTWEVSYTVDSQNPGTCNFSKPALGETVTVTETSPTSATIEFQGAGGGCAGALDACKLTVKCDATTTGGLSETRQDAWTFSSPTQLGGKTFYAYTDTKTGDHCTYNVLVNGTKQ